jgi:uncharacterized membrane protein YgcG
MRTLTALAAITLAAGIAAATPVTAATIEGKIMYLGQEEPSVTINKKTYRVSDSTKVIVSGKPGHYASLKPGMNCKTNVSNGALATSLVCTGKGRDPLPNPLPITNDQVTRPATGPAGSSASSGGGSSGGAGGSGGGSGGSGGGSGGAR